MNQLIIPPSTQLHRVLAALLLVAGLRGVQAAGPEALLDYRSPEIAAAEAAVGQAEAALAFSRGIGYGIGIDPNLSYGDLYNDTLPEGLRGDVEVELELDYRYNPVQVARDQRTLEDARVQLRAAARDGVEGALLAHTTLLSTQGELPLAEAELQAAEAVLAGPVPESDITQDSNILARDQAAVALEQAQSAYQTAQLDARRYDIDGPAEYAPLRFALPTANPQETPGHRALVLTLAEAEANFQRTSLFETIEEFQLGTGYDLEQVGVDASLGIYDKVPGSSLSVDYRYPTPKNPGWRVYVTAEIQLDRFVIEASSDGARNIASLKRQLAGYATAFERNQATQREAIALLERSLSLAERNLILIEQQNAEYRESLGPLQAQLTELQARYERYTDEAERRDLSAQLGVLQQTLAATERGVASAVNNERIARVTLYNAWADYVTAVGNYLELADKQWRLR